MTVPGLSTYVTAPLTPIDLLTATAELDRCAGSPAKVTQHVAGAQMGVTFESELLAVDSVGVGMCVMLKFANGAVIDLDFDETAFYIGGGAPGQERWLELHVLEGSVVLTIEDPA